MIDSSQRQISKYETGKNEPTAHVLDALANALGTTVDYILWRTDVMERPLRGSGDLDAEEIKVIKAMRDASDDGRRQIIRVVEALAEVG